MAKDLNDLWREVGCDAGRMAEAVESLMASAVPLEAPRKVSPPAPLTPRRIGDLFLAEGLCPREAADPRAPLDSEGLDWDTGTGRRQGWVLRFWREGWWWWNGRYYQAITPAEMGAYVAAFVLSREWVVTKRGKTERVAGDPTRATLANVLAGLAGRCVMPSAWDAPCWADGRSAGEVVVLRNGMVRVEDFFAAAKRGEAGLYQPEGHSPRLFAVCGLDYDFEGEATCPRWKEFLDRVLPGEAEQQVLAGWAGYCLTASHDFQKILLMVGDGANGKSVVMSTLRMLVGERNCSAVGLEQLHQPHALAGLVGKLLNTTSEWGHIESAGLAVLRRISGGEPVEINPKNRSQFVALLPTRFIVAANEVPRIPDRTDATWRRLLVLPFPVVIPEHERVPAEQLLSAFRKELPGMLLWALRGLWRLRQAGAFAESETMRRAKGEVREDSNPTATWCEDSLRLQPGAGLRIDEAHKEYMDWCKGAGHRPLARNHFAREVARWYRRTAQAEPNVTRVRLRSAGTRVRIMQGAEMAVEVQREAF